MQRPVVRGDAMTHGATVRLNIDLGELPDEPRELYALATVVNVACGGHAGDAATMLGACSLALAAGASIAAHPSYVDRASFGRVSPAEPVAPDAMEQAVFEQCAALARAAREASPRATSW